jgi:hypothetical protein
MIYRLPYPASNVEGLGIPIIDSCHSYRIMIPIDKTSGKLILVGISKSQSSFQMPNTIINPFWYWGMIRNEFCIREYLIGHDLSFWIPQPK